MAHETQNAVLDLPLIRPAYLAHVVLNSVNVAAMHAWYGTVLGAESAYALAGSRQADSSGQHFVVDLDFMTFDEEHHRIAFMRREGVPVDRAINHIAFTYRTLQDLAATWTRLKAGGIEPSFTIHHGPTISIYYHDPDGNRAELQVDVFPDIQMLSDWFADGNFNPNPQGRTFDFAALAEQIEGGTDAQHLLSNDGFINDYNRRLGVKEAPPYQGDGSAVARLPTFDSGVVRPAALAQVALNSSDVIRLSTWYDTVIGANHGTASPHPLAFHAAGDGRGTLDHIAFSYAAFDDLAATYDRLASHAILPIATRRHGNGIANIYADPEGNRIMLQADFPGGCDLPDEPVDFP